MAGDPPEPPVPILVVPDVVGKKLAGAEATLHAAGLEVGSAGTVVVFDSSAGGKVMSQGRNLGLNVPAGSTVNLTIGQWSGRNW